MAWLTTKDGRHFNTDWINDDNDRKEKQIAANKQEADKKNYGRLTSKDDESKLREELHEKLSEKDSYTKTPEYKALSEKVRVAWKEKDDIEAKMHEIRELEKQHTTLDWNSEEVKNARAAGLGKAEIEMLYEQKDDIGKQAEKDWRALQEQEKAITNKWQKATDQLKEYESQFVKGQKEQMQKATIEGKSTVSSKIKDDYEGFQLDTHTPAYQRLYEKGEAKIVEMSPKEYLQRCATDIFDSTYERQVRAVMADAKHTYELADMMKAGTKMYMPSLDYNNKGQEGRHRAAAAILNGIERMPVLIIPKRRY